MTTYTFGNDPNHFVEVPDETYVDPLGLGRTRTARPAAGFTVLVRDFVTNADLGPITTTDYGYFQPYTTTDVPAIKVSTDHWASFKVLVAEEFLQAASLVPVSQINATGTRSSSTFLRGDGTWTAPPGGSVSSTSISDASTVGKAVLTAADAAAARTAIAALAASAASAFALTLLDDTSAAAARTTLGAVGTNDIPRFNLTALPSGGDVWTYDDESGTYVPLAQNLPPTDTFDIRGATANPGDPVPANFPVGGWLAVRATAPVLGASIIGQNGVSTSSTSLNIPLTGGVGTTEDILVAVTAASPGTVLSSITVTDAGSTSYTLRGQRLQGSSVQVQVFKGRPTTSIASGSNVTVTFGAAVGDIEVVVIKLTGLAASSFDQQGLNSVTNGSTLALATGAATSVPNELAVIVQGFNGTANGAVVPTGWTQLGTTQSSGGTNPRYCAVMFKQLNAAGVVSTTLGTTTAGIIVGVLDTFKAA